MNENKELAVNGKVSESFSGITQERSSELASVAVAASARAEIESAYIMAMKNPRNEEDARIRILNRCKSLKFAEKAIYKKPVSGRFIEGLSIRFAEEILRLWRNIKTQQTTIFEDDFKKIVKIIVIDLETNSSYSREVVIEKHVERKNSKGRTVLGQRKNTQGLMVYKVVATEDEMTNKEQALASKCIRNNGLRLIPEDVKEEACEICRETIRKQIDLNPATARRQITDAFAEIGVYPKDLELYLKTTVESISPKQIEHLRTIYTAISGGYTTWVAVLEEINKEKTKEDNIAGGMVGYKKTKEEKIVESPQAEKLQTIPPTGAGEPPTRKTPAYSAGEESEGIIPENFVPVAPKADKKQTLVQRLIDSQAKIGNIAFFKILGAYGFESVEQVRNIGDLEKLLKEMTTFYNAKIGEVKSPIDPNEGKE